MSKFKKSFKLIITSLNCVTSMMVKKYTATVINTKLLEL